MSGIRKMGIVGPYPPFRGGISQFTEQFHLHLSKRSVQLTGVSFTRQYPGILFPGKSQESGGLTKRKSVARLIDSINPASWRQAADHLIQEGIEECIFMHWMPFFAPAYASMAKRLVNAGIKISVIVHNARPHERQPFGEALNRMFFKHCDLFVALSETVKRDLIAAGVHAAVHVHPHPTYEQFGNVKDKSQARERLGLNEDDDLLLFFGLVRRYKGLDILLEAMAGKAHSGRHLVVAGEWYEDRSICQSIIDRHSMADRVTIVDEYIPDEDVAFYFSAADAVVQPYRSATQSGVVQTAFNFGKPVVVTGVGGLPEMVRHEVDGLIVAPEDPTALCAALERLFEPGMIERLSSGALQARERFTWRAFTDPFVDSPAQKF